MTKAQEESFRKFDQYWYEQWHREYKNINGAFYDTAIIHQQPSIEESVVLLARAGKDSDIAEEQRVNWSLYVIDVDGKIFKLNVAEEVKI